jgi:hypothetical protein
MAKKKIIFGSTETQARKIMNDLRRSQGLPPIAAKRKKKKTKA